jgi:para-aminobenzoate synthetase component 2
VDDSSIPDHLELYSHQFKRHVREGIRHKELPIFAVQYHPSPVLVHMTAYLFDRFCI